MSLAVESKLIGANKNNWKRSQKESPGLSCPSTLQVDEFRDLFLIMKKKKKKEKETLEDKVYDNVTENIRLLLWLTNLDL